MSIETLASPQVRGAHSRVERQQARSVPRALALVPLAVILAAQALLTWRLLRVYPASSDESLYIYGGHQLINELWHGGGSPFYETWFSGAPDLYPVLAAMLDHVGGLYMVRGTSMVFMLAATFLLFAATRRTFGYWPAICAAGIFAGLGVTQDLGVLATFDAPSLFLTAFAAYCSVRAAEGGNAAVRWLLLVAPVLALANWFKYASLLFDPVVVAMAALLLLLRQEGWRRVGQRAAALTTAIALILGCTAFIAGSAYLQGIAYTTLNRKSGAQAMFGLTQASSAHAILVSSWNLIGLVIAFAVFSFVVAISVRGERGKLPLLLVLLVAGILVTLEGLHLRTTQSISKHDDFGVWFTCMAAGYALARTAELARNWPVKILVVAVAAAAVVWTGDHYSGHSTDGDQSRSDTDMTAFLTLRPYLSLQGGRFLLGGLADSRMLYDDQLSIPWWQYDDDEYIKYPLPGRGGDWHGQARGLACGGEGQPSASTLGCMYLEGMPGYEAAIRTHAFAVVSMVGGHGTDRDVAILAAVRSSPGYVLLTTQGGAPTFIYAPDYPAWERTHPHWDQKPETS